MAQRHEPEFLVAQRAFPMAQELLAGVALRTLGRVEVGWHDTRVHPSVGAFAVVADNGNLTDLIGEILRVSRGTREVFVYCVGARAVPVRLSLARRAFFGLGLLAHETLPCVVEVVS